MLRKGDGVYVPGEGAKKKFGLNDLYQAVIIIFTLGGFFAK